MAQEPCSVKPLNKKPMCPQDGLTHTSVCPQGGLTHTSVCELISWTPIALWQWDTNNPICLICRNSLMDSCIECAANNITPCQITIGSCKCAYHYHCMTKWMATSTKCPHHSDVVWAAS